MATGERAAAQRFYDARGYRGAAIAPSDFVVLAMLGEQVAGIGRLCQEGDLLWLRGMQVDPRWQRCGVGSLILQRLGREIGDRGCCCLPYSHLTGFYRQAGFQPAGQDLPPALAGRVAAYLSRGLQVVAMIRPAAAR